MVLSLNVFNSSLAVRGPSAQSDRVWTQLLFQCIGFANRLVVAQCEQQQQRHQQAQHGRTQKDKNRKSGGGNNNNDDDRNGDEGWNRAVKFLTDAKEMAEPADGVLCVDEQGDGARE